VAASQIGSDHSPERFPHYMHAIIAAAAAAAAAARSEKTGSYIK